MKSGQLNGLLCGVLLAGVSCFGGTVYRVFTSSDNQVVEAAIVNYNAVNKKILIERSDSKQVWVSPSVFCEADQAYIKQWMKVQQFLSNSNLRISVKKKTHNVSDVKTVLDFELTLQNRTDAPYENVKVDCRVFIKHKGYNGNPDNNRSELAQVEFKSIPPRGSATEKFSISLANKFEFVSHTYYDGYSGFETETDKTKIFRETFDGVWCKVYGPSVDGVAVERDFCDPKGVNKKKVWPVGKNRRK